MIETIQSKAFALYKTMWCLAPSFITFLRSLFGLLPSSGMVGLPSQFIQVRIIHWPLLPVPSALSAGPKLGLLIILIKV